MSRFRIALGAAAVAAAAAGIAIPATAGAEGDKMWTTPKPVVEQAPAPAAQPKWPGDPFEGKCVYWLKGDNQLRECKR